MKKILIFAILVFILLTLGATSLMAQVGKPCDTHAECGALECKCDPQLGDGDPEGTCQDPETVVICSPIGAKTWGDLIDNITTYIFWIATALAPVLIIIGALYFVMSGGSEERILRAKRIITYTIIGYLIVLFSKGLVAVLKNLVS